MSINDSTGENSTGTTDYTPDDRLPPAIGVDADGLVHHVAAQFPSTAILSDGDEVVTSYELPTLAGREDWVTEVTETRGWADCWADERLTPREVDQRIAEAQR
jgi:hypothetical protein